MRSEAQSNLCLKLMIFRLFEKKSQIGFNGFFKCEYGTCYYLGLLSQHKIYAEQALTGAITTLQKSD